MEKIIKKLKENSKKLEKNYKQRKELEKTIIELTTKYDSIIKLKNPETAKEEMERMETKKLIQLAEQINDELTKMLGTE